MSVSDNECGNKCEKNFELAQFPVHQKALTPNSKFNASFERKIERLWLRSRQPGWSYNDFVAHFLEVLVVMRHRNGVKLAAASKRRVTAQ